MCIEHKGLFRQDAQTSNFCLFVCLGFNVALKQTSNWRRRYCIIISMSGMNAPIDYYLFHSIASCFTLLNWADASSLNRSFVFTLFSNYHSGLASLLFGSSCSELVHGSWPNHLCLCLTKAFPTVLSKQKPDTDGAHSQMLVFSVNVSNPIWFCLLLVKTFNQCVWDILLDIL